METITGTFGVIGDYVIPLIVCGIMIGIAHIGIAKGIIINLRQGTYHDVKFHKLDQDQNNQELE